MQVIYLILGTALPVILADFWYNGKCLLWTFKVSLVLYLFIFGLLPLVFRYSYQLQKKMLFLNFINWPIGVDFTKPESIGINGARNFYVTTEDKVKIGVWQILPESLLSINIHNTTEAYEAVLKTATRPIFLYMHGNSGSRASGHRVELCRLLQQLNFHIITFDYRSYGDSDNVELSEMGVVNDSKYILEWLLKIVNKSAPVFVWGHSLGTGVSSHVLALLADEGASPGGLFLESPFNNLSDEIIHHPFSKLFKHLPWYHWAIVEPLYENNLRFESDKHIGKIKCPIMILHAEDDSIVPFSLGVKLYQRAKMLHKDNPNRIQMTIIDASLHLGHKYICRYKELPSVVKSFVEETARSESLW